MMNASSPDSSRPRADAPLSDDDQAEIRRLDALIAGGRHRVVQSRVSGTELKWMLIASVGIMFLCPIVYVNLNVQDRRLVTTYIAIAGTAVAGWGVFRAWLARRSRSIGGVATLYLMLFFLNFCICGVSVVSLTHAWDLLSAPVRDGQRKN
ncbi:MAG TPA: hypothetical protein VEJ63_08310 [Planctomycetota bacterium]|nr:hypothetical protein [Planctomycetota bacterium]